MHTDPIFESVAHGGRRAIQGANPEPHQLGNLPAGVRQHLIDRMRDRAGTPGAGRKARPAITVRMWDN